MIVFLTGSSWQRTEDLPFLRRATRVIQEHDGVLARDWIEPAFELSKKAVKQKIDWSRVIEGTMDAIARSDVVIIEATSYRFSQGYETATALQQKKPVLVISRLPLEDRSISGIKNRLLTIAYYKTEDDLDGIIGKFIRNNTVATKDLRFNFFIDRQIYSYLRSLSYETGKNKSEIIRDLINREIKRQKE